MERDGKRPEALKYRLYRLKRRKCLKCDRLMPKKTRLAGVCSECKRLFDYRECEEGAAA